ncbi:hypothetical protein ADK41_27330 [Streptomyces caelestis]|uniref:Uncharacterized protein n=1 Tax=Streptomyces caelestis TaxID=36816 RepID=A0A0M8QF89_9ACTN|nr:hypothetical protein ADK41_27330 [Streptomyces caelestis]
MTAEKRNGAGTGHGTDADGGPDGPRNPAEATVPLDLGSAPAPDRIADALLSRRRDHAPAGGDAAGRPAGAGRGRRLAA